MGFKQYIPLISPRLNILFYRNVFIPSNHTFRDRIFGKFFPTPMFGVLFGRNHLTEITGKISMSLTLKKKKIISSL